MAGPDNPLWVKRDASRKAAFSLATIVEVATPDSSENKASYFSRVNGTSAGRGVPTKRALTAPRARSAVFARSNTRPCGAPLCRARAATQRLFATAGVTYLRSQTPALTPGCRCLLSR